MANYTKHFNIPAVIITSIPINVMSMEKAPILRAIHTTFLAGPIRTVSYPNRYPAQSEVYCPSPIVSAVYRGRVLKMDL